jgi:hypothetical protein
MPGQRMRQPGILIKSGYLLFRYQLIRAEFIFRQAIDKLLNVFAILLDMR